MYLTTCSSRCDEVVNCSGHGRCSWSGGPCLCFAGWSGPNCKSPPDKISHDPLKTSFHATTAVSFTAVIPGLESLGAVEVLLPTVSLGVPSHDVTTTFSLPGPFSQIQITIPAGSWVARRRSDGRALTATVFSLPAAAGGGLPGAACGPAVDLGPHDVALAAPLLLALPCAGTPPDPAATPAIYGLSAGRWVALPLPAAGPAYANGTVWARPAALTVQAAFWIFPPPPPPPPAAAAGPVAGIIAAAVIGAAGCCLAAAAAAWWLRARPAATAARKLAAEPLLVALPDVSLPAAPAADSEALPAFTVSNRFLE